MRFYRRLSFPPDWHTNGPAEASQQNVAALHLALQMIKLQTKVKVCQENGFHSGKAITMMKQHAHNNTTYIWHLYLFIFFCIRWHIFLSNIMLLLSSVINTSTHYHYSVSSTQYISDPTPVQNNPMCKYCNTVSWFQSPLRMHIGIVNEQFSWTFLDKTSPREKQRSGIYHQQPWSGMVTVSLKPGAKGAADGALVHFYALCVLYSYSSYTDNLRFYLLL